MSKGERTGERKTRNRRKKRRTLELGYYLIITDTEATEGLYFTGLHDSLSEENRKKLVIKVENTSTKKMIDTCLKMTAYDAQYRIPWIVFDRDRVKDFDGIIQDAENQNINVGWSNPCFEIWMHAYFGDMPSIYESKSCCAKFGKVFKRKTTQEYDKSDKHIYNKLSRYGDEQSAIKIAEQCLRKCEREGKVKPSEMFPCTTVYRLVEEIKSKVYNE